MAKVLTCRVLGPLEVDLDGVVCAVPGPVPRRLIAALAVPESGPVVDDVLGNLVWGRARPGDEAAGLRVVVSRVRTALGAGGRGHLSRHPGGYALEAERDHRRFADLVQTGLENLHAGQPVAAVRALTEALGCWRGEPWSDLGDAASLAGARTRLGELRAVAVEEQQAARLGVGDPVAAVAALTVAVAEAPYRERRWELLATALYRTGRQAEALDQLRRVRTLLREDLGVDPGRSLRELEKRILAQDPALSPRTTTTVTEPSAGPDTGVPSRQPGGFVGRETELAAVTRLLDSQPRDRGPIALVTGEPGIGKSRLLDQFAMLAADHGWTVCRGRAPIRDGSPPFWLWRAALDGLLADDLLTAGPHGSPPAAGELPVEQRLVLFERVGRALDVAVADRAVVLVLDDLHRADEASLALLDHLLDRMRPGRLAVAAGARDAELDRPSARALAGRFARHGDVFALQGFSVAEVGEHLTNLYGDTPGHGDLLDPATVAAIGAHSHGNPLFVQELARVHRPGNSGPAPLPAVIRDAVGEHLDTLPAACHQVLTVAAVIGGDPDPVRVAAVADLPLAEVLSRLAVAVDGGVLIDLPYGRFAFRHDLFVETLRARLALPDRAGLHLRVAELAEERQAPVDGTRAAEIAWHRLAALPLGDPDTAARWAHTAGRHAAATLAYEDAAALFTRAVAVAGTGLASGERVRLRIDAARARFATGDTAGAIEQGIQAATLAAEANDIEALAAAALALPEVVDPQWLTQVALWCHRALAVLPDADTPLRARLLAQRALSGVYEVATTGPGAADARAGLAMAGRLGDDQALQVALRAAQVVAAGPGAHRERLGLGARMLDLGHRCGDPEAVAWGRLWRFDALLGGGDVDAAVLELDRLESLLDRLPQPVCWHAIRGRGAIALARGRFAAGRVLMDRAATLVPHGPRIRAAFCLAQEAMLSRLTGADLDVDRFVPTGLDHPMMALTANVHLGMWHLDLGRRSEAERCYRGLRPGEVPDAPPYFALVVHTATALLAAGLGDPDGALAAYRWLLPYSGQHATTAAGVATSLGPVDFALGRAATTAGLPRAGEHLNAAIAADDAAGFAPYAAIARYERARHQHARDPADPAALADARDADTAARQLGMHPLATRTAGLLATLESSPGRPHTSGPHPLQRS